MDKFNSVTTKEKTTLVLNAHYLPMYDTTARNAVHMLIRRRIVGFDRYLSPHTWNEWMELIPKSWSDEELDEAYFYPDHPCLPTSGRPVPIPTIVKTTSHFLYRTKNKKRRSRKWLIDFYDHTCQCCYQSFPACDLTIDHVHPKSKGGADCETNYLILCRWCNNQKGSVTPFFDVKGNELKAKPLPQVYSMVGKNHRPEWEKYLVFKK